MNSRQFLTRCAPFLIFVSVVLTAYQAGAQLPYLGPREFSAVDDSPRWVHPEIPLRDIFFAFDSSKISEEMKAVLEKNAVWFKNNPNYLILLSGHSDERGFDEYNLFLSKRRAMVVFYALIALGVEYQRMTIIYYGEEQPFAHGDNEESYKWNRRVHLLIKPYKMQ